MHLGMQVNWLDKLSDWGWQAFMALATAAIGWFFYIERKIANFRVHVSDNYVKKSDIRHGRTRAAHRQRV
jgi:hypothetical protein